MHDRHNMRISALGRRHSGERRKGMLGGRPWREMEDESLFATGPIGDLDPQIPFVGMHAEHVNDPGVITFADAMLIKLSGD